MTVRQAIDYARTMLDESGEEYYTDIDILIALEDAQISKAREYFYSGRKQYIQSLYTAENLTTGAISPRGDIVHVITGEPMIIEACFLRFYPGEFQPRRHAIYMQPERYFQYMFSNQGMTGKRSGKLQFTYVGGVIRHNGADDGFGQYDCRFVYYYEPTLTTFTSTFALPSYTHAEIADRAAGQLNIKSPGVTDHAASGQVNDILQR